MRKIISFVKKHTVIIILIAISILFPQSFSYQSKLNMRVIVTAIAVDKENEEYELTMQIVMPKTGAEQGSGTASLGFISEKGKSISEAIQKVAYKIGKTAGLSHVNTLIAGQSLLDGNLANELDYFVRNSELSGVVMLVIAPESAKEMLKKTKDLEINEAVRLQKVFVYKESSLNGLMMPVEKFVNDSLTISASSTASGILISKEGEEALGENTQATLSKESTTSSDQGAGQTDQAGAGSESESSSDQKGNSQAASSQNGRIKYYNDVYYFKNGKYVGKFDKEDEILGYFLSNRAPNTGEIVVEDVNGEYLKNATVALKFRKQETKEKIEFSDGKPVLIFDISFTDAKINEILNDGNLTPAIYEFQAESSDTNLKQAILERVESCVRAAFEKAKQDDVDVFKIADLAWKFKPKEWAKYYDKNGESYLKDAEIKVNVEVKNFN